MRILSLACLIVCALADNSPKEAAVEPHDVDKQPLNAHIKSLFVVRAKHPDKRSSPAEDRFQLTDHRAGLADNRMFRPFVRMLCPDNRAEWPYHRPLWPEDRAESAVELEPRV